MKNVGTIFTATLEMVVLGSFVVAAQSRIPASQTDAPNTSQTPATLSREIDVYTAAEVSVAPENIPALIESLAGGGAPVITQVRFFSNGELLAEGYMPSIERQRGSFNPIMKTLSIFGTVGGSPVVEDIHFIEHEGAYYVLNDVYLDNASILATPGRLLPHRLKTELVPKGETTAGTGGSQILAVTSMKPAPPPEVNSFEGSPVPVAGIAYNGLIEISGPPNPPCGTNYNSIRLVNARTMSSPFNDYLPTPFSWTLTGSNFGSVQGTIKLGPAMISITNWKSTQIAFLPLFPGSYTPLTPGAFSDTPLVLSVSTAATATSGPATSSYAITVASAYGTRVFGQCTWYAAYLRIIMGKLPPEISFPPAAGWAAMGPSYVPQAGDVLVWTWGDGAHQHTATVIQVTQTAPRTWKVTIGEMNYNCRNSVTSTTSTFSGVTGTWSSLSTMAVSGVPPYAYFR